LDHAGLPQIYFDQISVVAEHLRTIPKAHHASAPVKLTRRSLLRTEEWPEWQAAEHKQLDAYHKQGMFGTPCEPTPDASVFFWVWVYLIKPHENNRKKARAVCDGSTRGGASKINGHTFAPTPDMTDFRLQVAIAASLGYTLYCADVSNAFAEAEKPKQLYYMRVDDQYAEWWNSRFPDKPVHKGLVVPILRNLQGHPEAPRQWSIHIDRILKDLGFRSTTHAPCLYVGTVDGSTVYFLRQVDDFSVACKNANVYNSFCDLIDKHLSMPITRYGIMTHFNGIDVEQSHCYIHLHVKQYLDKVFAAHGWDSITPTTLPMRADNAFIRLLDKATSLDPDKHATTEHAMFSYRQAIGELVWPMITVRPDISFAVVKLSQFCTTPGLEHYKAVKQVFQYLSDKRTVGLVYKRSIPCPDLPHLPLLPRFSLPQERAHDHKPNLPLTTLYGYSDSDWAMDCRHRRSISGIVLKLSGAAISWKCRVQPTISLSTTEAEFLALTDAGRMVLCIRSILDELNFSQQHATKLFGDNRGAQMMTQAAQPTRQTRHIDIREFAVLDWCERDLMINDTVTSESNAADMVTKQTPKPVFHRHADNVLGLQILHDTHGT
jgi:hypothetical protein